ncbi:MAG: hypothetical protein P8X95_21515 [Anaerolineales bacterium]|jgi:hypothetical protein
MVVYRIPEIPEPPAVEPGIRQGWWPARRPGAGHGGRPAAGGEPLPLGVDDATVADHERGAERRQPRPDDGPPQGQPHPGTLTFEMTSGSDNLRTQSAHPSNPCSG